jgi:hypothetical protein
MMPSINKESSFKIPEHVTLSLGRAQKRYQILHAHKEFGEARGFDMRQASRENFAGVRQRLRDGLKAPGMAAPSVPRVHEAAPKDTLLTSLEADAFVFILENLAVQHASSSFAQCDGRLLSLKQRERRDMRVGDRHTPTIWHDDDNVFLTLGFGAHAPVRFLLNESNLEVFNLPLEVTYAKKPELLEGLWVSPHYTRIEENYQEPRKYFATTGFEFFMDKKSESMRYVYTRADATRTERTFKLRDMALVGDHVGPGLAYLFLEHLRYIGEPYRSETLKAFVDPGLSQNAKFALAGAAMAHLLSPEVFPEAKVPVQLPLDQDLGTIKSIEPSYFNNWLRNNKDKKFHEKFDLAVRFGDLKAIEKAICRVNWKTIRSAELYAQLFSEYDSKPSNMDAFLRTVRNDARPAQRKPETVGMILALYIKHNVTAFGEDIASDALHFAIKHHAAPAVVDQLLAARFPDPRDPRIEVRAIPSSNNLVQAVKTPGMLAVYAKHGMLLEPHSQTVLKSYLEDVFENDSCLTPKSLGPEFQMLVDHGGIPSGPNAVFEVLFCILKANDPDAFADILAKSALTPASERPYGANGTMYTPEGQTLLHLAANAGRPEILSQLIAFGCDVNARTESNCSPYGYTVERIRVLKINIADAEQTADARELAHGTIKNLEACQRLLCEGGAVPDAEGWEISNNPRAAIVTVAVTGIGRDGRTKVLMGLPRDQEPDTKPGKGVWQLPNGSKESAGGDLVTNARLMLQYQTGITGPALDRVLPDKTKPVLRLKHESVSGTIIAYSLFHVDIGADIDFLNLNSGFNWTRVAVVDVDSPHVNASRGAAEVIKASVKKFYGEAIRGIQLQYDGNYMIVAALQSGKLGEAKALVTEGARLSHLMHGSALLAAVKSGEVEAVEWVLALGAKPKAAAFGAARAPSHEAILDALIERVTPQDPEFQQAVLEAHDTSQTSALAASKLVAHALNAENPGRASNNALVAAAAHKLWKAADEVWTKHIAPALAEQTKSRYRDADTENSRLLLLRKDEGRYGMIGFFPDDALVAKLKGWANDAREAGQLDVANRLDSMANVKGFGFNIAPARRNHFWRRLWYRFRKI